MKNFILIIVIASALGLGITLKNYSTAKLAEENAFADEFLSLLEETIPNLKWPENMSLSSTNDLVKVPILVYHSVRPPFATQTKLMKDYNVSPVAFTAQLKYLKDNHYNIISMNALDDYFSKKIALPDKPVILTFDDGWENQYKYAFQILKNFNTTGTFFIYTNAIDKKHFLTWPQVKEMAAAGMTIGAHTKSHPYLIKISQNIAKLRDEIIGGKKVLEEHLGAPVDFFAYPFGHYNNEILAVIKEAGFKMARSTYTDVYQTSENLYTLHGNEVREPISQFTQMLTQTAFVNAK